MKEHLHAEFLRAIADGESIDDWEATVGDCGPWGYINFADVAVICSQKTKYQLRRKQKMLSINGHEFPEPMRIAPKDGESYWLANPSEVEPNKHEWKRDALDKRWLSSGLCHSTSEAAEAHRRAIILASGGTL